MYGQLFDFSSGGYSANGDVQVIGICPLAYNGHACLTTLWDHNEESPSINSYGTVELSSITTINVSEVTPKTPSMLNDYCYVIQTREGNYAKFRVTNTPNSDVTMNVDIEYYYQSDGSTTFSQ